MNIYTTRVDFGTQADRCQMVFILISINNFVVLWVRGKGLKSERRGGPKGRD